MCKSCLKNLRIAALDYFRCLYDDMGVFGYRNEADAEEYDEDATMSEETFNHLIRMHDSCEIHELLSMIATNEKARWEIDQQEKLKEIAIKMLKKYGPIDLTDKEMEDFKDEIDNIINGVNNERD